MIKQYLTKKNLNILLVSLLPLIFYVGVRFLVTNNPHTICIFKLLTGHDCWGCGMTRAFNALFQLDFKHAFELNPRIVIVAPLMFWAWISTLIRCVNTEKFQNHAETEIISK